MEAILLPVMISVPIWIPIMPFMPKYPFPCLSGEKRASSFKVGMATDYLNQVTDQVKLEVETARVSLSQTMEQVRLTEGSLSKAFENERMALERYTEGKASVIEVIEAQTYRQASQLNHVQAKVSAQGAYSELIRALNKY